MVIGGLLFFLGFRFNSQAFKKVEGGFLLFEVELVEVEGNGGAIDREIEVVVGNFLAFSIDEGFGGDFKGAVKSFHFVFFLSSLPLANARHKARVALSRQKGFRGKPLAVGGLDFP